MTVSALPQPTKGSLTIYFLGPGIGESQIVILPDDRTMVVDGCSKDGENFPAAVLQHLGRSRIDMLVLTHSDYDHVKGVADVVSKYKPGRIWRYPGLNTERDEVAAALDQDPNNTQYKELRDALDAINDYGRNGGFVDEAQYSIRPWQPINAPYRIHCLAPTHADISRSFVDYGRSIERQGSNIVVSARRRGIMMGTVKLHDKPNKLSLAIVIEWGERKVLLAGDVENGPNENAGSGWKGVLRELDAPDMKLGHIVDNVHLVKVAHHGSSGAFHSPAWQRHALGTKTTAVICPFSSKSLPPQSTLGWLRGHCKSLGLTSDGGAAFARATSAGWTRDASAAGASNFPCVVAELTPSGDVSLRACTTSATFI